MMSAFATGIELVGGCADCCIAATAAATADVAVGFTVAADVGDG